MRKVISAVILIVIWALPVSAQDRAWVQIEAQPTLRQAQERASAYANVFREVNGYQLRSGWYAIALGPYAPDAALDQLSYLRSERLIPGDSFIADGGQFRQQFWPVGANNQLAALPQAVAPTAPADAPQAAPSTILPDETPAEARRSERDLTREARMELQEALKWEGVYTAGIDGAFGPGTRNAMAAWQSQNGFEATGILTTRQRADLLKGMREALATLGLQNIEDQAAGIRVTLPAALVGFSRYEAPFAHYDEQNGSGVQALLISQKGDQNTLFGLYDIMQTLEIVPLTGMRERFDSSFVLTGQSTTLQSYTYAALQNGMVKGFTLVWRPEDEKLMNRAVQIMRDTFQPFGDALDDSAGTATTEQRTDLLSGLDIRRPELSRTGFYVDGRGTVLTTTQVLHQCQRITIGDDFEAEVMAQDDALGLAVLRPKQSLAPMAFAAFQTGVPRLQSDVAVAGFSYGDLLDLPVLTYGTLADLRGLDGQEDKRRLDLNVLPGDAGGPVYDTSGAVMGILLARADDARQLPGGVSFAASVAAIAGFLSASGIDMAPAETGIAIAPEDLTSLAADMTVRVSCWN